MIRKLPAAVAIAYIWLVVNEGAGQKMWMCSLFFMGWDDKVSNLILKIWEIIVLLLGGEPVAPVSAAEEGEEAATTSVPVGVFQPSGLFSSRTYMRNAEEFSGDLLNLTVCHRTRVQHLRGIFTYQLSYAQQGADGALIVGESEKKEEEKCG